MSEEEEENERLDLSAWEPQLPPSDFAERVLAEVRPAKEPQKRSGRWRWFAGAGVAAAAAAVFVFGASPPSRGDEIARERIEVSIGNRARAVLEPGAHVTWNGDEVTQPNGDVFYRVEPGAKFRVHTPAGDVEVKGTCFTVKVADMQKRDMKSGAIGAALSALAFVAVYEGKVAVSHAGQRADLYDEVGRPRLEHLEAEHLQQRARGHQPQQAEQEGEQAEDGDGPAGRGAREPHGKPPVEGRGTSSGGRRGPLRPTLLR